MRAVTFAVRTATCFSSSVILSLSVGMLRLVDDVSAVVAVDVLWMLLHRVDGQNLIVFTVLAVNVSLLARTTSKALSCAGVAVGGCVVGV
ncbi:MAG: hypothetical protein OK454_02110, partial [Thaumarchaeota archaeon]|nr:hypothetical protein [Nitrososphaerota archaeon]